jgi:hypothetical protein
MNTNEPNSDDQALRKLLKEWRIEAPLPPRFQDSVLRRIERGQAPAVPSLLDAISRWIGTALPRPAVAAVYLAVLLITGGTAGWTQAHHETARVKEDLGQRYVRVLDPYLAPRE